MAKEFSKESRRKALKEAYGDRGKSGGTYYLLDDTEMEEKYDIKKFKPKAGNVFIAILPRWEDPKFFIEFFVHGFIGPNKMSFLCPAKMFDEVCPICEYARELRESGEPDDACSPYWVRTRVLLWIVNMDNRRSINDGVYIYDGPKAILDGIVGQTENDRTGEVIDISESEEKKNLTFKRVGEGYNTKYVAFKLEDRDEEIPKGYYDLPEMLDMFISPDITVMKKALGMKEDIGERPDEEEVERGSRRSERNSDDSDRETVEDEDGTESVRGRRGRRESTEEEDDRTFKDDTERKRRTNVDVADVRGTQEEDDLPFEKPARSRQDSTEDDVSRKRRNQDEDDDKEAIKKRIKQKLQRRNR